MMLKGIGQVKKAMHRHPVSPTGVAVSFLDLFKVCKLFFGLFKVSEMLILIMTC